MNIEYINFFSNLKYMGVGMLAIFAVIAVIIVAVGFLQKITSEKDD